MSNNSKPMLTWTDVTDATQDPRLGAPPERIEAHHGAFGTAKAFALVQGPTKHNDRWRAFMHATSGAHKDFTSLEDARSWADSEAVKFLHRYGLTPKPGR
jgi:hypothetical protein